MAIIDIARPAVCICPKATVSDAVNLMAREGVGAVIVTDPDQFILGIFSERDNLTRVVALKRDPATTPVNTVMTAPVDTVSSDVDPDLALDKMIRNRFRHVPIVDAQRHV